MSKTSIATKKGRRKGGRFSPNGGRKGATHHPALASEGPVISIPLLIAGCREKDEDEARGGREGGREGGRDMRNVVDIR